MKFLCQTVKRKDVFGPKKENNEQHNNIFLRHLVYTNKSIRKRFLCTLLTEARLLLFSRLEHFEQIVVVVWIFEAIVDLL